MNSCYGKTIQKAIDKDMKYIPDGDEYEKYYLKNYNKIVEDTIIDGSNIHAIKTRKSIDTHFCFSLLGIHVLSMSKRIMNEVMCLAEDIGARIYYQDTDSMHIRLSDLEPLELAFKNKYGSELRGNQLGQFHSDFTSMHGRSDVQYASESLFIAKKIYIDKLLLSDGSTDYMFRGKGLTNASILTAAMKCGGLMELYMKLYDGEEITFNLCDGQPCFKMEKNMTVTTIQKFERTIKTIYEIGIDQ